MRVILIDEEPLLLDALVSRLSEFKDIHVVGKYTSPYKALNNIDSDNPEVIFLDVELGCMNGIEVVEIAQSKSSTIKIVFVTSNPNYAIQAFELNAVDYLVRPFCKERLTETIERLRGNRMTYRSRKKSHKQVCLFNAIQFINSYQRVLDVRWRTKKAQELFALLMHHHEEGLSKEYIVDQLWPCYQWENGVSLLYNSIYHLRRVLEDIDFDITVQNEDNTYTLHVNDVQVDIHLWQEKIDSLPDLNKETYDYHKYVIHLYKGDYLKSHSYHWCEKERSQNRSIWLYHVRQVTNFLVEQEEYFEAIQLHHYVQSVNPTIEESYFNLMKLYHYVNDKEAVMTQYNTLRKTLQSEYEVEPNAKITNWYKDWQANDKVIS